MIYSVSGRGFCAFTLPDLLKIGNVYDYDGKRALHASGGEQSGLRRDFLTGKVIMMEDRKNSIDKLLSGREYRNMPVMQIRAGEKGTDGGKKIVEGYATKFNVEYELYNWGDYIVREKIDPHAFDECDMSDVIMQYDHTGRVFARKTNGTLELRVDNIGLHTSADLGGTQLGGQLYEEIDGGYTTKMSFGFRVAEDKREIIEDHETHVITVLRTVTKISKLYDVSPVSIPANDATEISARSFCDGVIAEIKAERLKALEQERRRKALRLRLKLAGMQD